jgi:hypothetical protein
MENNMFEGKLIVCGFTAHNKTVYAWQPLARQFKSQ